MQLDSLKFDAHNLFAGGYASSDGESLPDETSSTWGSEQTHAARHGFLFGHNLNSSSPDLDNLHPLPSQIPFLLDLFSDNVNMILQVVHLPTVRKMVRDWRDRDMKGLTPAQEALMFSIYYAAITSMEDEDVSFYFRGLKQRGFVELNMLMPRQFETSGPPKPS